MFKQLYYTLQSLGNVVVGTPQRSTKAHSSRRIAALLWVFMNGLGILSMPSLAISYALWYDCPEASPGTEQA